VSTLRGTGQCAIGVTHPHYTYSRCVSEDRAISEAVSALDRMGTNPTLRLAEVHRKHVSAEQWLKVE
jgi:hypothetical protein